MLKSMMMEGLLKLKAKLGSELRQGDNKGEKIW